MSITEGAEGVIAIAEWHPITAQTFSQAELFPFLAQPDPFLSNGARQDPRVRLHIRRRQRAPSHRYISKTVRVELLGGKSGGIKVLDTPNTLHDVLIRDW